MPIGLVSVATNEAELAGMPYCVPADKLLWLALTPPIIVTLPVAPLEMLSAATPTYAGLVLDLTT